MLSRTSPEDFDVVFAWGKYLHWEDRMYRNFEKYFTEKGDAATENNQESLGVFCYWAASLYVVIEGWESANFHDSIIDALLGISNYKDALRRLRNGTFHYQPSVFPDKVMAFFQSWEVTLWALTMHEEFCRCLRDWVEKVSGQTRLGQELREEIGQVIGWIPLRPVEDHLKALRKKFDEIEAELDASGSTTLEAQDLRATLSLYEDAVSGTAASVRESRRERLAHFGLNPDDYIL